MTKPTQQTGQPAVPVHVAIIPDGNRRWAKQRGLSAMEGHRAGYQNAFDVAEWAAARGVKHLTFYAFSTENWRRAEEEVGFLLKLLGRFLDGEAKRLSRQGFRIRFFGSRQGLRPELVKQLEAVEAATADNAGSEVNICFNYGGRRDLVEAVQAVVRSGMPAAEIDEAVIAEHLSSRGTPPPDLVVRTSGEQRLSNYLLWEAAYAELIFVDQFWPDFDEALLDKVLAEYAQRQRRYGA